MKSLCEGDPTRARQRLRTLANCVALGLGLGGSIGCAAATTAYVNNCGERIGKGIVTLRSAVNHAGDGDIIDLSRLECSTITLTGGEIPVAVDNLTIQATVNNPVTVDAGYGSRVFNHTRNGTLSLDYLNTVHGNDANAATHGGGCMRSAGSLVLNHSSASHCASPLGPGGAIYTKANTTLLHSIVSDSTAHYGAGGVQAMGSMLAKYSTITHTTSFNLSGIFAATHVVLDHSIVSNNTSSIGCGGVQTGSYVTANYSLLSGNEGNAAICLGVSANATLKGTTISATKGQGISMSSSNVPLTSTLILANSTITGSTRQGASLKGVNFKAYNSTIAFNAFDGVEMAYAKDAENHFVYGSVTLQSSIIAQNFGAHDIFLAFDYAVPITSSNNIVGVSNRAFASTISENPLLAPLGFHGGAVPTLALLPNSPAIDAGNDVANLAYDSRGSGFSRLVGNGFDIGAYERQVEDDELFYNGLE